MLHCVIIDDEIGAVEILSDYIGQTKDLHLQATFRDAVKALNYLTRNNADLLFLDIEMPNLSGMQLAELLRDHGILIIFCTAYSEFAMQSYEKDAIDYLLKPIPYDRFLNAVDKARRRKNYTGQPLSVSSYDKLFVKSGSKIHQLNLKNLLYMKKDSHYVEFHTTQGNILSRMNMEELLNSLPSDRCVRIHKSYVIVLDKIETIERHDVYIAGRAIPIGRSYREDFFQRISYSGN